MELGRAIRQDERYLRLVAAKEKNDADKQLQSAIGEFESARLRLEEECAKDSGDNNLLSELDREVNEAYAAIMSNPSMREYSEAKSEISKIISKIKAIIECAAEGINFEDACETCPGCGKGRCGL
jgi:cell fate (sporulation/competence/biofilm development) regulator YlbF (YheA/YmcA/DUF963 family)